MKNQLISNRSKIRGRALLPLKSFFLIFLFLLTTTTCLAASSYAQNKVFTIQASGKTVQQIFNEIEKTSEFIIFYRDGAVDLNRKVSVNVVGQSIEKVLEQLFKNTENTYSIKDRQISILKKESPLPATTQQKGKVKITGIVTDPKGESIIGANVVVKGSPSIGTITNIEGRYELYVPSDDAILLVSYLGYNTEEVKTKARSNINVLLHEDSKALGEVVVIGYGKQKKESVVASMSSITPKEIVVPSRSLVNSLAGQVAGLIAVQRSGEPGYDDAEFWIRGISTFAGGQNPLVLVDGVPRAMSNIEPDEIETFSILKDAAATAIYGAEGANGVVLVTTKRGRVEKAKISFKTEHTISSPTRLPEFVGSADYLDLYNEALNNDGEPGMFSPELIAHYRNGDDADLYPNTNWLGELVRKNTFTHRYSLNVRGGTERAKYFVSGAYFNESGLFNSRPNGVYDTNIGIDRFNLRSNIDMEVSNTTTVGVDLAIQYLISNYPGKGSNYIFHQMMMTPPYVCPAVYSDGTTSTYEKEQSTLMRNPYNELMNSGYSKEYRTGIQSKVTLNQKLDFITKGLSLNGNVSYDYDGKMVIRREYNPTRYHATGRDENGALKFATVVSGDPDIKDPKNSPATAIKKIYIDASLNYKHTFGLHDVGGMVLYMQKETQNHDVALPFRKQGIVGRATYGYDGRYFLEANFGYTGSETFAAGYRFGFFPAVGVAYYLSNEPFYPKALKNYVNKLKLRASVGRTGNDQTNTDGGRFLYRPTYGMAGGGFTQGITDAGGSNGIANGIIEGRFSAPYLAWEVEQKQNYSLEMGLFNNRIDIVLEYFRSTRQDILLQRKTVPDLGGFRQAPWENFGKVSNHGVDLSANLNQQIGKVKLSARGTFTYSRNKILEYDELPQKYAYQAVTGTRVNENTLFIADRLYREEDFIVNTNANDLKTYILRPELPQSTLGGAIGPGDIKYVDVNGDGVLDSYDKVRGVGNPEVPEIVYGFGFNAEYKGIYASIFFQGVGNTSVQLGGGDQAWYPFAWGVDMSNYRTFALDRWTEKNPSQDVLMPRLHKSFNMQNNRVPSTWWMRDGSFLRLKNIEVGYQIPKKALSKIGFENARIYLMGYNLAVWDKIDYFDPEAGSANAGLNYPLPRTFTLGIDFTF